EIRDFALSFIEKAQKDGKPFFCWLNPTRMHIITHLSDKYEKMRNAENGWSEEEAGMAQLDDDIGLVMQHLKDMGVDNNTIVVFTTDNGTESFTWPDGGTTPFAQAKGTVMEGGFRVPCILKWPGHVPADSVKNGIFSGMDWPNVGTKEGAQEYFDWFVLQFWRFVFVQQLMGKELQTFLDYPPMQRGASFNLDAVKAEMAKKMAQAEAASKGPSQ